MSKNPALLQKVLEDWLRLQERQELFAGLPIILEISALCLRFHFLRVLLILLLHGLDLVNRI